MKSKKHIKSISLPTINKWKKEEFEKDGFENYYLYGLFISSLLILVQGINIYRLSFIEFKYLFLIVAFGTLGFWFSHIIKFSRFEMTSISLLIFSLIIGGSLSYSFFLFSNYYFAEKNFKIENYKIEKTGELAKGLKGSCGNPYAEINYKGIFKHLVFSCQIEGEISSYQFVELKIHKGLFNFDIVGEQKLVKELLLPTTKTSLGM